MFPMFTPQKKDEIYSGIFLTLIDLHKVPMMATVPALLLSCSGLGMIIAMNSKEETENRDRSNTRLRSDQVLLHIFHQ